MCCAGIACLYVLCEAGRFFGSVDIMLALYFFPANMFPKFAMYIPVSHAVEWREKFQEYIFDPHIIKIIIYESFIKLPVAFFLSGICLILFGGVVSILLSPLMYWIMPHYFADQRFCLFGTTTKLHGNIRCSGWAVVEFGDTMGAFLLFLPILPLTMHLCRFGAKALLAVTNNFLTVDVGTSVRNIVM
ncbi:hypothetical protein RFI_12000 [Reticulomyxa filosa]|uniref:Uncharacterized protein n=1 Tax=Reticulomyxa filosa TaxID=46433 RepID=X6NIG2_RETFI|nr:hypothetical protein RFI_12000 [Reticulomyxa filosa]|eukprot:ETO25142.1 hypothetical protein RFI_12000 [Reticulomyxa filosa]